MSYRLPPLNALRLFEAAGRHLSFKAAAEESNITPSAVSHGIQSLEEWLGVELFVRAGRTLSLTSAGKYYLPHVRVALEQIARSSEAVPGRRPTGRLSISVAPSFAHCWLVPHLHDFRDKHPAIEVVLDTSRERIEFPRDGIDIAIRRGEGKWDELYSECLFMEDLIPVCSPAIARSIRSYGDLADHTLLHVTDVAEDWVAWSAMAGQDGINLMRGLRFDTVQLAMEAVIQGLGVAIGRLPIMLQPIADGRLETVLGPVRRGQVGYWFVAGHESMSRPEIRTFHDWMMQSLKPTG
jgi:LysR family transcriptional regulator, glycine cleavage system transcriptional activator